MLNGAGAVLLASGAYVKKHGLKPRALDVAGNGLLQEIPLKRPLAEISVGLYRRSDSPTSVAMNDFWKHAVACTRELWRV